MQPACYIVTFSSHFLIIAILIEKSLRPSGKYGPSEMHWESYNPYHLATLMQRLGNFCSAILVIVFSGDLCDGLLNQSDTELGGHVILLSPIRDLTGLRITSFSRSCMHFPLDGEVEKGWGGLPFHFVFVVFNRHFLAFCHSTGKKKTNLKSYNTKQN